MKQTIVKHFFDPATWALSYIVYQVGCPECAIIDSVLDFDLKSGRSSTTSADKLIAFIQENELQVQWILETHVHADHLTAASYLQKNVGGKIGIGQHVIDVQSTFKSLFDLGAEYLLDGSQFDHLFADNEEFFIGELSCKVLHVPGHTPADVAYQIGNSVFVGDTIFMPDIGTARCDFPGGSANSLYKSIQRLLSLPEDSRIFCCHDYPPNGRSVAWEISIQEQRHSNIHLKGNISERKFVEMRRLKDQNLPVPNLIIPSLQVNLLCGKFPKTGSNGIICLKIPINVL
jgi:glyoxylase-like metal-dependent hydrolase (beta-lactamase superfamily II)